ncbi:MAG: ABC transporter substrate-binding protein [Sphaerochaeta sp.]|jgi:multiple sugar transport system substrate-binding protein|nr:ABC transporter substrate-binding protein [Sphaerochaeta sp.]
MKKRGRGLWCALLVLLCCVSGLFAGGAKEAPATQSVPVTTETPKIDPSKYAVTAPIEITWWHALENQYSGLVDEIVNDFNNSQDKIKVKAEYIGSYSTVNETLVAAQVAGTGLPALVVANTPYVAQYGASGLCEDLTPYIQATGFDIHDFGEGMIQAAAYDGKQVSLPFLISTQILYYNKDMAKAKGVEIPTQFKDMKEFLAKVSEFNADGTTKVWGTIIPGWDQWYFETFFLNNGVNIVNPDGISTDLDGKASVETTKAIGDWINNGYAYFAVGKDASSIMRQTFIDKKAFSVIHTTSLYNTYVDKCKDFEVGMAWLPATDTRKQEIGGCVLLIPAKNDQQTKNAAWQFLSYLCSKDINMKWAEGTGYMPTRKSVLETQEGKDFLARKPAFKAIFDNLDNIYPRIQNKNWNQLAKIWMNYLSEFYNNGQDINKGIPQMAEEINEVLED